MLEARALTAGCQLRVRYGSCRRGTEVSVVGTLRELDEQSKRRRV